jgi:hypothetical protein
MEPDTQIKRLRLSHGGSVKIAIYTQFILLGLALSIPVAAQTKATSAQPTAQEEAQKSQAKAQEDAQKAQ